MFAPFDLLKILLKIHHNALISKLLFLFIDISRSFQYFWPFPQQWLSSRPQWTCSSWGTVMALPRPSSPFLVRSTLRFPNLFPVHRRPTLPHPGHPFAQLMTTFLNLYVFIKLYQIFVTMLLFTQFKKKQSGIPIFTMDGSPASKRYRQISSTGIPLKREETLMFRKTFPENMYANSDFVSYGTNCDFSADTPLYIVQNVTDPIKCGSHFCYGDRRCTHFSHQYSTNLCRIISSFGSGSTLVSRVTDIQAGHICGFIPNRACNPNSSLQKCITLDV